MILLNQNVFHGDDTFKLDVRIYSPLTTMTVDEYIVLDIASTYYYFWPSWGQGADSKAVNLIPGYDETENIFTFTWPDGVGSAGNLRFWAAMIDPETMQLYGQYDMEEWSYE